MNKIPNFIGVSFYWMDAKNRLAIPIKFRSLLGADALILSQGLEGCLNLYSSDGWAKLNEKLESAPMKNKIEQRAFKRMLFSSASEVAFDEEGRILIPAPLVEYSRIKQEAAIVGMGDRIEIWAKSVWNQYQKKQRSTFVKHAAELEF